MKNKKLFVFDLDGTLLNDQHNISHENLEALKKAKEKGHIISVATGRNYIFAKKALRKDWNEFDYYIGCNAAIIHDIKKEEHFHSRKTIDIGFLRSIVDELKQIGGGLHVSTNWKMFTEVHITRDKQWFNQGFEKELFDSYPPIDQMSDIDKKLIMQVTVHLEEHQVRKYANKWKEQFKDYDFTITSKHNIDINIKNINKLAGVKYIASKEKVAFNDVFAFGDSQNDIENLKYYKNTYAMGNALEETKEVAKEVIGNNNTNAIAKVILKNI